jgi:hypothetical protein
VYGVGAECRFNPKENKTLTLFETYSSRPKELITRMVESLLKYVKTLNREEALSYLVNEYKWESCEELLVAVMMMGYTMKGIDETMRGEVERQAWIEALEYAIDNISDFYGYVILSIRFNELLRRLGGGGTGGKA